MTGVEHPRGTCCFIHYPLECAYISGSHFCWPNNQNCHKKSSAHFRLVWWKNKLWTLCYGRWIHKLEYILGKLAEMLRLVFIHAQKLSCGCQRKCASKDWANNLYTCKICILTLCMMHTCKNKINIHRQISSFAGG